MKRLRRLLALTALLLFALPAMADTFYVQVEGDLALSIRDEFTNEVLGYIPSGEAVIPDPDKSTELAAYVTYNGVSGFVLWRYLTRTAPGAGPTPAAATPAPAPSEAPIAEVELDDGTFEITVTGGEIHRANARNKPEGEAVKALTVKPEEQIIISAVEPRGKKVDYWVINGIRYDFDRRVNSFRLTKADRDWDFEIVYTKSNASTVLTSDQILAARTGETLLLNTVNAELCHIKSGTKGAGGWIASFDFTHDYTNRATGALEPGGQVTAKVRAIIPRNKTVSGWKFNETELYPNREVTWLLPHMLNTSMTYEPIFVGKAATNPPVTNRPSPVTHYSVTCVNCTFTGGGYTNATSGTVPAGTQISVRCTENSSEVYWEINGSSTGKLGRTITRTINTNTRFYAMPVIN